MQWELILVECGCIRVQKADQLNRSVQARAFTTGKDVFFKQGEYNPGSRGGQELIAHELTHVVQQGGNCLQNSYLSKSGVTEKTPNQFTSHTEKSIQRKVEQRDISQIAAESKILASHFEDWKQSQTGGTEQKTELMMWLTLKQVAKREQKFIRRNQETEEYVDYTKEEAIQKLLSEAKQTVLNEIKSSKLANSEIELYDKDKNNQDKPRTGLETIHVPNIGTAKFEYYSKGNDKLLFCAHGFTKKNHIQQMLSKVGSWDQGKIVGFMKKEFETLYRGGGLDIFLGKVKQLGTQLDQANQSSATKGVKDTVVAPHIGGDSIADEIPEMIENIADTYDIAILRDWQWNEQELRGIESQEPSPIEYAYVTTVPIDLLLTTQKLNTYKKVALQICRTGWSKGAGGGMGGYSSGRSGPTEELEFATGWE